MRVCVRIEWDDVNAVNASVGTFVTVILWPNVILDR